MRMCGCDYLQRVIHEGAQAIDVREEIEYKSEHIPGTSHVPLSTLCEEQLTDLKKDRPLYIVCKSGVRSQKAAERLINLGFGQIYILEGGLDAWRQAGMPLNCGLEMHVWNLDRQVRFLAGSFVLAGIILSLALHRAFIIISLAVGAGLIFSAITNTCTMAILLAKMPWNKTKR